MNKYFLNVFYLTLLFIFVSCSSNEKQQYFSEYNYKISKNGQLVSHPSANLEIVLPVSDKENKYEIVAENFIGREVYEKYYKTKYSDYVEFLNQLYKKNLYINSDFLYKSYLHSKIETSDSIHNEFSKYGLKYIIEKYCVKKQSIEYWKTRFASKPALSLSTQRSLIKIMYNNNYYIVFDDYSGEYIFLKDKIKVE